MVQTTTLSEQERRDVLGLVTTCHEVDGSARIPYLSNDLNADEIMPAFFLSYKDGKLVGVLTVYADDGEAELYLTVHPAYRRQGIATQLYHDFTSATAAYDLTNIIFQSEKVFLDQHPALLKAWDLVVTDNSETQLGRGRLPYQLSPLPDVSVLLAEAAHIDAIATFQSQAFGEKIALARRYASQAVEDKETLLYILVRNSQVLGSCTVDMKSSVNYLYGLAVLESERGQGLASHLVKCLVNDLLHRNDKTFQIAVEDSNIGAKRLYQKLGFIPETQVIYLEKRKG